MNKILFILMLKTCLYSYGNNTLISEANPLTVDLNHNCSAMIDTIRNQKLITLGGISLSAFTGYFLSKISLHKKLSLIEIEIQKHSAIHNNLDITLSHLNDKQTAIQDYRNKIIPLYKLTQELYSTKNESLIDFDFYKLLKQEVNELKKVDSLINSLKSPQVNPAQLKVLSDRLEISLQSLSNLVQVEQKMLILHINKVLGITKDHNRVFRFLRHLPLLGAILGSSIFFTIDLLTHSNETSDGTLDSWILKDENFFSNTISPETICSILATSSVNNQKIATEKIQNVLDLITFENANYYQ